MANSTRNHKLINKTRRSSFGEQLNITRPQIGNRDFVVTTKLSQINSDCPMIVTSLFVAVGFFHDRYKIL